MIFSLYPPRYFDPVERDLNRYLKEQEDSELFWEAVYQYMEDHDCDEAEAQAALNKMKDEAAIDTYEIYHDPSDLLY